MFFGEPPQDMRLGRSEAAGEGAGRKVSETLSELQRGHVTIVTGSKLSSRLLPGSDSTFRLLARLRGDCLASFWAPVRDEYVDAVLTVRRLREARLAVGSETQERAKAATIQEACLAAMIGEAEIRDTVCGIVAMLNAEEGVL